MPYTAGQLQAELIVTSYQTRQVGALQPNANTSHNPCCIVLKPLHPTKYKIWQKFAFHFRAHAHPTWGYSKTQSFYFVSSLVSGMGRITKRDLNHFDIRSKRVIRFRASCLWSKCCCFFLFVFFHKVCFCLPSWYVALARLRHRIHL